VSEAPLRTQPPRCLHLLRFVHPSSQFHTAMRTFQSTVNERMRREGVVAEATSASSSSRTRCLTAVACFIQRIPTLITLDNNRLPMISRYRPWTRRGRRVTCEVVFAVDAHARLRKRRFCRHKSLNLRNRLRKHEAWPASEEVAVRGQLAPSFVNGDVLVLSLRSCTIAAAGLLVQLIVAPLNRTTTPVTCAGDRLLDLLRRCHPECVCAVRWRRLILICVARLIVIALAKDGRGQVAKYVSRPKTRGGLDPT